MMNKLDLPKPKQRKTRRRKAVVIAIFAALALCGAAIFLGFKLRGDPEVMDDIERHFKHLERYAAKPIEYASSAGADRNEDRDEHLFSRGRRTASSGEAARRASRSERNRPKRSDSRHSGLHGASRLPEVESRWEGIRLVAPLAYTIDAALLDEARKGPRRFTGSAWATLAKVEGEPAGFRINGIREGDAIQALGLLNGDVVTAVNGHELKGVDEALAAAAALSFSQKFRVDILRGSQKLSLYYRVQ
jgi:hypothetical protein